MKESTRQKLRVASTASRFFFAGVLVGAGAFAFWAKRADIISDDIRLTFVFMLVLPVVLLLAHMPALILQIGEGISKTKQPSKGGPQNQQVHGTAYRRP